MTRSDFVTIRTTVSTEDDRDTGRLIGRREEELNRWAQSGYSHANTLTIPSPGQVTIVDTLQKTIEN